MFNVTQLVEMKSILAQDENITKWLTSDKAGQVFKDTSKEFLLNHKLDSQFIDALNSLKGEMLEQTAVSKLSYKIPTYRCVLGKYSTFYQVESNLVVAKTLLDNLVNLGYLHSTSEVIKEVSEEGKVTWVTKTVLFFEEATPKDLSEGVHTVPGVVMQKTVHVKTGGKEIKLNAEQKGLAGDISSMPFRLAKTSAEWFMEYFKQSSWYVKALALGSEDRIKLDLRAKSYVAVIMELQDKPELFLSIWYDSRYRMYYDFNLMGVNPHGKLGETAQWERAEAKLLTDVDMEVMEDSVVKIATGKRYTHSTNCDMFRENSAEYLAILVDATKWDMDDLFYNTRLVQAIEDFKNSIPSHFILAEDCTTGGLQHGGIGFRSEKSMILGNVGGDTEQVHDAHGEIVKQFKIASRKQAKDDINTPLLHGSTLKTIQKALLSHGTDMTEIAIEEYLVEVYGAEILNIPVIANWGGIAVSNKTTSLMFKTSDGWLAQSTSYMESVPLLVYALSTSNKAGFGKSTIVRDMPLLLDAKGQAVYGKDNKVPGSKKGVTVKKRGLYANITHSIDAKALRDIARMAIAKGEVVLFKHDDFICTPSLIMAVRETYKSSLVEEFEFRAYHKALEDIKAYSTEAIKVPVLVEGTATVDMIKNSSGFLSA